MPPYEESLEESQPSSSSRTLNAIMLDVAEPLRADQPTGSLLADAPTNLLASNCRSVGQSAAIALPAAVALMATSALPQVEAELGTEDPSLPPSH